ncbi:queuine tRNA-ribosyltransferase [Legionella norrlandica]|uniref:Queuine tRNA-ribosyltransferase n=1 Tax=Legionella norrlandica TaxID=1498499 RepID=A0A0A2SVE5_9GAMM|nr:queuine tRNA-ribosyltransferase [Legionella norrlandica]KGP63374.1 queuine tRNA-ribosyltransferase [Legionella norrlandica]
MVNATQNFIPVLSSEAGLCLTAANWQEVNIKIVSYYLDLLLLKPGYPFLNEITDLGKYLGWPGNFVINASRLIANKEGVVTVISPYDGSRLKLTNVEIVDLILHLKPNAVLLPKTIINNCSEIWDRWDEAILPFLPEEHVMQKEVPGRYGIYFTLNDIKNDQNLSDRWNKWVNIPLYVSGEIDIDLIRFLSKEEGILVESDEPAKNAMHGIVYSKEGRINLTDEKFALNFKLIDEDCACPTCSSQFTRAYLHHLLANTPLLCQRFLIQHNTYYVQQ